MHTFSQLSRKRRLYRFRALARSALDVYGYAHARLKFLQYFENIIYRVDVPGMAKHSSKDDPYLPGRYVLRIHALGDAGAIGSELTWLSALSQEAGLLVPAPIMTLDGKPLAKIVTSDIPAGRVISLMRWLDGRRPRKALTPKQMAALGQVVAQMHVFAAGWQLPAGFTRPHWDWDALLGGSLFKRSMDEVVATIPAKFLHPFQVISKKAKQVMSSFGKGPEAYGMIHGDLYPENVLFKAGKALPIDFEDCGFGHWMMDIAVPLCGFAWGSEWERMRDAFHTGYSRVRVLPESQWACIDLFVAIQFAAMVVWSSALLMNDPKRAGEYDPWREKVGNQLLGYFNR